MNQSVSPFQARSEIRSGVLITTITRIAGSNTPPPRVRIVQLSDMHYGIATSRHHLEKIVQTALDLKPDCIVVTGDFIQATRASFITLAYARINRGPYTWLAYRRKVQKLVRELHEIIKPLTDVAATFAVPGNHDHEEGLGTILRCLPNSIRWITNAATVHSVNGVHLGLAGVDDLRLGKPLLPTKFPPSFADAHLKILLTHQPDFLVRQSAEALLPFDLALAGHTHGGQICLPKFGPIVTRTKHREQASGFSHRTALPLYVTRGVGFGAIPLRINCPPEIVVIDI